MVFLTACSASPSVASPLASVLGTRPPAGSPSDVPSATPVPFVVPLLADPASVTGICSPPPADSDGAIPCEEAFREAIRAAGPRSAEVYRLEFAYGAPCAPSALCPSPSSNVGYVILKSINEVSVVIIAPADDGRVQAWPPQPTTLDLFRSASFSALPVARPSLPGDPSSELAGRTPLPFCGRAQMTRATPSSAELCFREAVLAGQPAELVAIGSSVEGADLVEVLRYLGEGAINRDVYQSSNALGESGEWQHATTVLQLQLVGGIEL
jgi:hypothetical protein